MVMLGVNNLTKSSESLLPLSVWPFQRVIVQHIRVTRVNLLVDQRQGVVTPLGAVVTTATGVKKF